MAKKIEDPDVDVITFKNIDDKKFTIYAGGKAVAKLQPGEEEKLVYWVATLGAKHLVDRILQEKHGVRLVSHDSPLKKSLFAKILPDKAEEYDVKPLTPEQEQEEIRKALAQQKKTIDELFAQKDERDESVEKLKAEVAELKAKLAAGEKKKVGRPPKIE